MSMKIFDFLTKEFLLPLLLTILFFLSSNGIISEILYVIIALFTSFYFFPLRIIINPIIINSTKQQKLLLSLSSFILSTIVILSILGFYIDLTSDTFFKLAVYTLGFLNVFFLFYFHYVNQPRSIFITHFCFMFLIALMI